jgi:hypothetical protein
MIALKAEGKICAAIEREILEAHGRFARTVHGPDQLQPLDL